MDDLLMTVLTGLPNFAIAVYVIWRQDQRLDKLLAAQEKLIAHFTGAKVETVKEPKELPNTRQ